MPDTFVIFYDGGVLVAVTGVLSLALQNTQSILDWYAREYAFDRSRLTGVWTHSISVSNMKYSDFHIEDKSEYEPVEPLDHSVDCTCSHSDCPGTYLAKVKKKRKDSP